MSPDMLPWVTNTAASCADCAAAVAAARHSLLSVYYWVLVQVQAAGDWLSGARADHLTGDWGVPAGAGEGAGSEGRFALASAAILCRTAGTNIGGLYAAPS